jgi:hypothetical protein
MRHIAIVLLLSTICAPVRAEEFLCTYSWPDQTQAHSALLDVDGQKVIMRGGLLNLEFLVAANSSTELLLYKPFTKENSGSDYPVGFTTMALDKKTKVFVYSNSFAGGDQNNHAKGSCEAVLRD